MPGRLVEEGDRLARGSTPSSSSSSSPVSVGDRITFNAGTRRAVKVSQPPLSNGELSQDCVVNRVSVRPAGWRPQRDQFPSVLKRRETSGKRKRIGNRRRARDDCVVVSEASPLNVPRACRTGFFVSEPLVPGEGRGQSRRSLLPRAYRSGIYDLPYCKRGRRGW